MQGRYAMLASGVQEMQRVGLLAQGHLLAAEAALELGLSSLSIHGDTMQVPWQARAATSVQALLLGM